jgi:hypothetical protein
MKRVKNTLVARKKIFFKIAYHKWKIVNSEKLGDVRGLSGTLDVLRVLYNDFG